MKKNVWWLVFKYVFKNTSKIKKIVKEDDTIKIYELASDFVDYMLKNLQININVVNESNISINDKKILYIANHYSMYDPLFIFNNLNHPVGFLVAKEFEKFKKLKIVNYIIKKSKTVYIDRDNLKSAAMSIKEISDNIKKYEMNYMIFPEGKIKIENETFDGKTGEFLAGVFKLAQRNEMKIVPISIIDSDKIHNTTNYLEKLKSGTVNVIFNKELEYEDYKDLTTQEIAKKVKTIIDSKLKEQDGTKI